MYKIKPSLTEKKLKREAKVSKVALDKEDGIRRIGGKEELYHMVLKEYYNENQETISLLRQAMESKDYAEAEQIVHKIKSSSGSIGAKELHEVAANFQKALSNAELAVMNELYADFNELLKIALAEIEEIKLPK